MLIALVLALVLGYFAINLNALPESPDTTTLPTITTAPEESTSPTETTSPEETIPPVETTLPPETTLPEVTTEDTTSYLDPDGTYTTKEDVALYIYLYGELPKSLGGRAAVWSATHRACASAVTASATTRESYLMLPVESGQSATLTPWVQNPVVPSESFSPTTV